MTPSQVQETIAAVSAFGNFKPEIGIVLGTGLGDLVNHVDVAATIPYARLPHFPVSTVESHAGQLIFGHLAGKSVVIMKGRFHYYEGYSLQQVTFPIRVMSAMGVKSLIVSNAAGGITTGLTPGTLMIINDHINLLNDSPLRGKHFNDWGPRFPDMYHAYDQAYLNLAVHKAESLNINIATGVYASVPGPQLETQAEYRYLKYIGADAVGMSTVPEVIVARQMGLRVLAISAITDEAFPEKPVPVTLATVIAAAAKAEPHLVKLISACISDM